MLKQNPEVTKTVAGAVANFGKMFNSKQYEQLATLYYTEDAKMLPPHMPLLSGRAAIGRAFHELAQIYSDLSITAGPVVVSGELAVTNGTYTAKCKLSTGQTVDDRGKFVEAWRQEADGSWRCFLDTFTSNLKFHD